MFGSSKAKYKEVINAVLKSKNFDQEGLEQEIIHAFYRILLLWSMQNTLTPTTETAEYTDEQLLEIRKNNSNSDSPPDIEQVKDIWGEYCQALPEPLNEKAHKLTHLVTGAPQTLPENFTYVDIFKAVFLMAIPELLLQKRFETTFRGRSDDLFGSITYQQQDGRYTLYIGNSDDITSFEKFVAKTEIDRGEKSDFKTFENFLLQQETLDRYTVAEFSLIFFDKVLSFSQRFLATSPDKELSSVCDMLQLDIEACIHYVHDFFAWWVTAYIFEKRKSSDLNIGSLSEKDEEEKRFRMRHELAHFNAARNMYTEKDILKKATNLPTTYSNDNPSANIITRYRQHVMLKICLGIAPAITEHQIMVQEKTYQTECKARTDLLSNDPWDHNNARNILGLKEDESYQKFICAPYTFPDCAFNLPLAENIEDKKILDYFFVSSIDFLRQVDKKRCRVILYDSIIAYLWDGFLQDVRCTENIKQRCAHINLTPYRGALDIILEIFTYGPVKPQALAAFVQLLKTVAKTNSALLLVVIQSLAAHAVTQPAVSITIQESYIMLHLLEKIHALKSTSNTLLAMVIILQSSHLSAIQRLALIGVIAQAALSRTTAAKIQRRKFYNNIQHLTFLLEETPTLKFTDYIRAALGKNVITSIELVASETKLSTLLSWYASTHYQHKPAPVLTAHIASLCSPKQLITLKNHLEEFASLHNRLTHFPRIVRKKNIQAVIYKIEQQAPAAEILLALKMTAENEKNNLKINLILKNFYRVINDFFSNNAMSNSEKTMDKLLNNIQQVLPEESTEVAVTLTS